MITVEFIVPSFDDAHDLLVYRVTDVTTTTTTTTTASSSSYIPLGTSCSGASFAKTHAVVGLHRKQVDEDQDKNKNNNTHFVTVTTTTTTPIVLVVCQHATVVAASYTLPMTTLLWWLQPNDENDSNEDAFPAFTLMTVDMRSPNNSMIPSITKTTTRHKLSPPDVIIVAITNSSTAAATATATTTTSPLQQQALIQILYATHTKWVPQIGDVCPTTTTSENNSNNNPTQLQPLIPHPTYPLTMGMLLLQQQQQPLSSSTKTWPVVVVLACSIFTGQKTTKNDQPTTGSHHKDDDDDDEILLRVSGRIRIK
uniref:Uncharacterized protein n=1 Tax=Amphora coffeiformis TaxID=265554 RepID=A0A7S3L4B2_9STRA